MTTGQFESKAVSIDSIDASGIHSGTELFRWPGVLEITQSVTSPATPPGGWVLMLRGGDKISGSVSSFNGDTLAFSSPRLGPIKFPADSVLGIVAQGYSAGDLDRASSDDVVHLANGDSMHGIINSISPAGVTLQVGDATPTLAWDAIKAVRFAGAAAPRKQPSRMFRVHLSGGESLTASEISLSGTTFTLGFLDNPVKQIEAPQVAAVEQLGGPVEWLTSLRPIENIYRPMFSENFPTRFDFTVADGRPIAEKYPSFHHGIGCHSYSRLVYQLSGEWAGFRSQFAIDSDSPLADVTVRVALDDKVVREWKNVKAGRVYPAFEIPLGKSSRLSLEVDYGENLATEDRFVWLDPALVKDFSEPATQP